MALPDPAPDARHAFGTGIGRAHLQADVRLVHAQVHDAATRLLVRPIGDFLKGVVHPPHDDVAREQERDGQTERRRREQVPIVRVHEMAVPFTEAEPIALVPHPRQQDDDGILREVSALADFVDAGEDGLRAQASIRATLRPDELRDGVDGQQGPFRKAQMPEGTIGPPQQCCK